MHLRIQWLMLILCFVCFTGCRDSKENIPVTDAPVKDHSIRKIPPAGCDNPPPSAEEIYNADPEWCGWRGPGGDGIYPSVNWSPYALINPGALLWEKNVGRGYAALSIQDYRLYTIGNTRKRDTVFCLDAKIGVVLWEYSYPSDPGYWQGPRATPVVDGDRVYVISRVGLLHCLEAKTGKVIWERNLKKDYAMGMHFYGISGSPVIDGDILLLNLNMSGMALNKYTGDLIWNSPTEQNSFASPVLYRAGNDTCAVLFGRQAVRGINAASGTVLWEYPWITYEDINAADPLVIGNTVFVTSNYNKGCALLDITDNKPRRLWQNKNLMSHVSSCIYLNGYLYGNNGDINKSKGEFRCLDMKTGKIQWSSGESGVGSLLASNGYLLLLTEKGELRIVPAVPEKYEVTASRQVLKPNCWTAPVFYKGRLYCRNDRGDIVCINLRIDYKKQWLYDTNN